MGLSGRWLEVARHVGVEQWLEIWAILDRENIDGPGTARENVRVRVPMYSRFLRYIRNRWIQEMSDKPSDEIRSLLEEHRLEPVSIQSIKLIKKGKA